MMLVISLVLGIIPLLGIVWAIIDGSLFTVDGLFMSIILLTLSAILLMNAAWEAKSMGLLKVLERKRKTPPPAAKS